MNWYKVAQSKGIEGAISKLEGRGVDPKTLDWIRTLQDAGARATVIKRLMQDPKLTRERLESAAEKSTRDRERYNASRVEPLTEEEKELLNRHPELAKWGARELMRHTGQERREEFQFLSENFDLISDWYHGTNPNLEDTNLTSRRVVEDIEANHKKKVEETNREYLPTDPANVVKRYPNGWTWQRITKRMDAIAEGNRMGHCMKGEGHCKAIELGKEIPYSLRDKNNNPKVTLHFKYNHVMLEEAKGYNNSDPTSEYLSYIQDLIAAISEMHPETQPAYFKERYLASHAKKMGLKSWGSITEKDFLSDPFLQKVTVNAIERGDFGDIENFAERWVKSIFDRHEGPPESWKRGVNLAIKNVDPLGVAYFWAKKTLESGKAPQWLIDAINIRIKEKGFAPNFARDWAKNILESGKAPQEWIDRINSYIKERGFAPSFAEDWAKKTLESGKAPQGLIDAINIQIKEFGYVPRFAQDWYRRRLTGTG